MAIDLTDHQIPQVECSTIVYRALLKNGWFDPETEEIVDEAYLPRNNEDDGLSVIVSDHVPQEDEHDLHNLNKCYGIDSLHVGTLRDLGLMVIQDEEHHALIVGVPHQQDDPYAANIIAKRLVACSRRCWRRKPKNRYVHFAP